MLGLNGDGILESDSLSIPKRISKILSMETKSGDVGWRSTILLISGPLRGLERDH